MAKDEWSSILGAVDFVVYTHSTAVEIWHVNSPMVDMKTSRIWKFRFIETEKEPSKRRGWGIVASYTNCLTRGRRIAGVDH
jgi:hypothetical protein